MAVMKHVDIMLRPDPSRTVVRPFSPDYPDAFKVPGTSRVQEIIDRVLAFDEDKLDAQFVAVRGALGDQHGDVDALLDRRFDEVKALLPEAGGCDAPRRRLIGAFLCEEYAFEAAALFNPSIVAHPEQDGVAPGAVRFVMSLRGIGEGHVSSVTFRTGTWTPGGAIEVDPPSVTAVAPIFAPARPMATPAR